MGSTGGGATALAPTTRDRVSRVVGAVTASPWLAVAIVVVFAAQAAVLAFTLKASIYDEAYHVSAIRYFADGATPFSTQPDDLRGVGDVERYGSYLYHWLLSFPYRWSAGMAADHRLVVLRLCSIGMVSLGLLALRPLASAMDLSSRAANLVVLVVAAVPMVTYLGMTVNYDNLMFVLLVLMWLAAVRLYRAPGLALLLWAAFLVTASALALAKYSALPVIAVTGVVVLVRRIVVARTRAGRLTEPALPPPGWPRVRLVAALVAAVAAVAAVVERYGINLLRFGKPQPDCSDVQTLVTCLSWAPWRRNHELDPTFSDLAPSLAGLVRYVTHEWLPGMATTFTYYGALDAEGSHGTWGAHATAAVLLLGFAALLGALLLGSAAALRPPGAAMLVLGCLGYVVALVWQNYTDYRALGEPIGVQGRYLLPLLPVLVILGVRATVHLVAANGRRAGVVRAGLLVLVVLGLTQGAGSLGVLARSDDSWLRATGAAPATRVLRDVAQTLILDDDLVPDVRVVVGTGAAP